MRNTAFFLAGMLLLLLQSNMFRVFSWVHVPGLVPSLVLPLILFMGVHEYSLARGAAVAFVLGYGTDLVGIAPVGLYTFTYVAIFVLVRAAGVRLAAQTVLMQVALALVAALVHSVMVLGLIAIFGRDAYVPRAIYAMAFPHALSTAAIAPIVFRVSRKLHAATSTAPHVEAARGT
ncbi:hypothetical protein LZC95_36550 [Pendulispora brunnea]|uniref:Rod shape-determining protein MreD n=1 Tax=Pendulispora brunnea TaxID=2905690 RepID=A0ABZ2JZM8_9BACT